MVTGIGIVIVLGLLANALFEKLKLPGLLGMLLLGIAIGPYGLGLLGPDLLLVSADFRRIALIIILLRAGLGISRDVLNRVGATAVKLSFVPGLLEGFAVAFAATAIFGIPLVEGGILGFVVAAVSPAVVVPLMLRLSERRLGTGKGIPTLILAGASIDDVFAITIFSTFLGMYGGTVDVGLEIVSVPISIALGIGTGIVAGLLLVRLFARFHMRDTRKVLSILGAAIMLSALEKLMEHTVEIAGLLGVMTIGFILLERMPHVARRLAAKFGKIWVFAEILLFVLVGAQVNISVALDSGLAGLAIIGIGLLFRSAGVIVSTIGAGLSVKERLFCVIAYVPKATVQAAIGAIPLSAGVASGELILAVAVLSILVTAPLGAIGIEWTSKRFLAAEA